MIEQEMASIIKFVLDNAGGPAPYYWNVPASYVVPAAFFPPPEIDTGGETFLTYYVDYIWHIRLAKRSGQGAYAMGSAVVNAIRAARNLVPLIALDGSTIAGSWVRVNDPRLALLDNDDAQLTVTWRSRRPYSDTSEERERAQAINVDVFMKSGKTITDAYAEALESYAVPLNPGGQPE